MKRAWVNGLAALIAITSWMRAGDAEALATTTGCVQVDSCTLQELTQGASMTVNQTLFTNWSVSDASSNPVVLSDIRVFPLDDEIARPGLRYVASADALQSLGFDEVDLDIFHAISVLGGSRRIAGASLLVTDVDFALGNTGGLVKLSTDILADNGVDVLGELDVLALPAAPPPLAEQLAFAGAASIIVQTNILITGDDPVDQVRLGSFTQRVSEIPEPGSLAILGLALTAIWNVGRSSIKKRSA
ncbi:MAG: hypothetical protein AW08_03309 [Candidatus Accumulibacter adjunctus]|uniref:PEP-CTERM protein-sorting domain-containing protein n=1 Tax=Candidatus Accumulibacter adjunctus TaxID=1454001 RepID=A0A011MRN5_9PROT|nr:MAG: hypothetical protein AW08_03309 [Candidatus Accumulibacter adjunctus]